MDWCKRNPLFALWLALSALLLVAGGILTRQYQAESVRALRALEQKQAERDWLARQHPAPSEENTRAVAAELTTATRNLAALRSALQGRAPAALTAPPAPAKPIDGYFELAAFIETTRALAARQQVTLKDDEHFSFATYRNEGPEPDLLPAVHRQRLLVQHLVENLLEARPRELLAVQRERPLTAGQRQMRSTPSPAGKTAAADTPPPRAGEVAADFFAPDPQLILRAPGLYDGEALRVEFTGQTGTLRAFLNTLANFQLPLLVRSVEVQPLSIGAATPPEEMAAAPGRSTAPVPLVTQNLSKFAVIVEFIELPPPSAAPGT